MPAIAFVDFCFQKLLTIAHCHVVGVSTSKLLDQTNSGTSRDVDLLGVRGCPRYPPISASKLGFSPLKTLIQLIK